jgi:hypothetical protein
MDEGKLERWDSGFVDALCEPPQSFTFGGVLAHVVTFPPTAVKYC